MVRERPILFSGPMVRAILEGRKTQTRRVVKVSRLSGTGWPMPTLAKTTPTVSECYGPHCPYGQPGDRLWVRETWGPCAGGVVYRADETVAAVCPDAGRWKPSIFMPRWASRITLEVTGVRVERLQDISEEDSRAEGAVFHNGGPIGHSGWRHDERDVHDSARSSFARLWVDINGLESLKANPWVWVLEFRPIEADRKAVAHG